jgi:uncharacterized protein (TIGR00299 family) protein
MKILYFDCPMGISGDMCLGSLIDLGVDLRLILRGLKCLGLKGFEVKVRKEERHSISATSFRVVCGDSRKHRSFGHIKDMIGRSPLKDEVKGLSIDIFRTIAKAEGKIHGVPPLEVHFHEIGALDSIVDIVGASIAIDSLGIEMFCSSPIPLGSGWVSTMHGTLPIPAPATLEILKGVPIGASDAPFELTTPTGAAIIKTLSRAYGAMPPMAVEGIGYGAGKKDFRERANVARVVLGEALKGMVPSEGDVVVMETNIDDLSPQVAGYLMERLYEAGALEVFYTPVQMKKNRPGVLLTLLAEEKVAETLLNVIFTESTSIGVRTCQARRHCLERRLETVKTGYGPVTVKVSIMDGAVVNVQPEYEDCRRLALKRGAALKDVMDAARSMYRGQKALRKKLKN